MALIAKGFSSAVARFSCFWHYNRYDSAGRFEVLYALGCDGQAYFDTCDGTGRFDASRLLENCGVD